MRSALHSILRNADTAEDLHVQTMYSTSSCLRDFHQSIPWTLNHMAQQAPCFAEVVDKVDDSVEFWRIRESPQLLVLLSYSGVRRPMADDLERSFPLG